MSDAEPRRARTSGLLAGASLGWGIDYDTLRQALADAAQHPSETPWIVTLSGKILKPREVADLISTLDADESDARIRCFTWRKMRSQTGCTPQGRRARRVQ